MWQIEDIIRAYELSLSRIRREYVELFDYKREEKDELVDWFGNLVNMMNSEGLRQKGHLQINKIIIEELMELHSKLLSSKKYPFYSSEYYRVLPFIVELRNRGASKEENEIETCFNALYLLMTLRLAKKEVSPQTEHAIKEITTFIGMLSDYYLKNNEEPLEFD